MKNVVFLTVAVLALGLAGCGSSGSNSINIPGTSIPTPPVGDCQYGVDAQTMKCIVPEDANKSGQGRTN